MFFPPWVQWLESYWFDDNLGGALERRCGGGGVSRRTRWFCAAEFLIDGALGLLLLLGASGHRGSAWRAVPGVFCGFGLLIEGLI